MVFAAVILQLDAGSRASIPGLVAQASPFSKGVLLLLLVLSVYSWAVIWNRLQRFARVQKQDEAIRELEQASGRHIGIVGLSAHALVGFRERSLEAGMDTYITKPIQAGSVLEVVKSLLGIP